MSPSPHEQERGELESLAKAGWEEPEVYPPVREAWKSCQKGGGWWKPGWGMELRAVARTVLQSKGSRAQLRPGTRPVAGLLGSPRPGSIIQKANYGPFRDKLRKRQLAWLSSKRISCFLELRK